MAQGALNWSKGLGKRAAACLNLPQVDASLIAASAAAAAVALTER